MALLFLANTINIGADFAAMGEAAALLVQVHGTWMAAGFGLLSILLQVFVPYSRYVRILQWLTLSLLAYAGVLFTIHIPWHQVLHDTLLPHVRADKAFWAMFVGVLGTTISPYLFFWQSAQEVEEQRACADEHRRNRRTSCTACRSIRCWAWVFPTWWVSASCWRQQ